MLSIVVSHSLAPLSLSLFPILLFLTHPSLSPSLSLFLPLLSLSLFPPFSLTRSLSLSIYQYINLFLPLCTFISPPLSLSHTKYLSHHIPSLYLSPYSLSLSIPHSPPLPLWLSHNLSPVPHPLSLSHPPTSLLLPHLSLSLSPSLSISFSLPPLSIFHSPLYLSLLPLSLSHSLLSLYNP